MNKMPANEWQGFKADMMVAFIGALLLLIALLIWLRMPAPVTLINEPCAPSHPSFMNGERIGCTNDPSSDGGWHPEWSPDEMP